MLAINSLASLYHLLLFSDHRFATKTAIRTVSGEACSFAELRQSVEKVAAHLQRAGFVKGDRIAIYAPKCIETLAAIVACNAAGCIFVPVNPRLKEHQVKYILEDSGCKLLMTTVSGWSSLRGAVGSGGGACLLLDAESGAAAYRTITDSASGALQPCAVLDGDPCAILYTSGSTGAPKGVVLSQRNLVAGALSVAEYTRISEADIVLGVLPASFDAGLNQFTSTLAAGGTYVPLNYLLPGEVPKACESLGVTAITAVPPLWMQLAGAEWSHSAREKIRVFANTGGHVPRALLGRLRALFPNALPFLMYGLTEAFRSTYLDPDEVDERPGSIGKAVPNAEISVRRANGEECEPGEVGELVHRGAFVTLGYWNDPEETARRFRPSRATGSPYADERVVWSGDLVRKDDEGFLYFVGRQDDMIKTSGYRVSPTEIENVIFQSGLVSEAAAAGVPHDELGEAIVAWVVPSATPLPTSALLGHCKRMLPTYMVPIAIESVASLPRNANGKIDRNRLKRERSETAGIEVIDA